jgi:hypothetical protein
MNDGIKDTLRSIPYLSESVQAVRRLFGQTPQQEYRHMYFPETTYPDDVFVTSYPKSGNTWVRLLLTEVLADADEQGSGWERHHRVVPDLYRNREWADATSRPRYMKTHEAWFDLYPQCLYIVRDGRDTMVSYYHYLQGFRDNIDSFSRFLRNQAKWPTDWHVHVERAIAAAAERPDDFLIVRFEDLKTDDVAELRRMVSFCNIDADEHDIIRAAEQCRFDRLKNKEKQYGHPDKAEEAGSFFRSGSTRQWDDYFSDADLNWFLHRSRDAMEHLDYL